jgi:hypothetical protein
VEKIMTNYLSALAFGKMQVAHNMAVLPVMSPYKSGPKYLVLAEAIEQHLLVVTEVSEGGSVPELKVATNADLAVLLLDGEELSGAKQNRVLNTTILLKRKSHTVIPVSCTERGRWSYMSPEFAASGAVMMPRQRMRKSRSVAMSLEASREFRADQADVWNGVQELSRAASAPSPTDAMNDVFNARQADLKDYTAAFVAEPGQCGLLVFINGEVVGFDAFSRADACAKLHAKLVRSYAMEALLARGAQDGEAGEDKARAFLGLAAACEEKKFRSVSLGWDRRYRGKGIVGSALVYYGKAIHAAFFRAEEGGDPGRISSLRDRRWFRL